MLCVHINGVKVKWDESLVGRNMFRKPEKGPEMAIDMLENAQSKKATMEGQDGPELCGGLRWANFFDSTPETLEPKQQICFSTSPKEKLEKRKENPEARETFKYSLFHTA